MEPQPTKDEILLKWFLGDSKEIADQLTQASEQANAALAAITSASVELGHVIADGKAELITAHRELVAFVRETEARQRQLVDALDGQSRRLLRQTQNRTVAIGATLAALGGIVGGGFAAWCLLHLLG